MSGGLALTTEELARAAQRLLGTSAFRLLNFTVRALGGGAGGGGGFLGEHRLVDVTVRLEDSDAAPRVLHFFYKTEPHAVPDQKQIISALRCFQKEAAALDRLFPRFRAALAGGGEGVEWTCKCYYTRPDIVVLENLAAQGFRLIDNRDPIGFEHCAAVLRALANLHAASLVFEESRPTQPYRLDSEYSDLLAEGFFTHGYPGSQWLKAGIKSVWTFVEQIRGEEFLKRTKTQIEEAMLSFFELEKPSRRFRNVFNQGDMWRNNIFFRFEDDKPVEVRLVDFQLVRYAPPANEIRCFLHLSTNRALRDEYGPQLFALYYAHLSENLQRHGLDPEKILPWEEFKESCEVYKKLGILASAGYCSVNFHGGDNLKHVLASSEEFQRFLLNDRTKEITHSFNNDDFYRGWITEIVEELIDEFIDK